MIPARRFLLLFAAWALLTAPSARGQSTAQRFALRIEGGPNVPRVTLRNTSRTAEIRRFEMTVGHADKGFDAVYYFSTDAGVSILSSSPDGNDDGGSRNQTVTITLSGLTPGKAVSFYVDVDKRDGNSAEDFRRVLFNNGDHANSVVSVNSATDGSGESASLTLPDGPADRYAYDFAGGPAGRGLRVKSITEASGGEYVRRVTVKVNNQIVQDILGNDTENIGEEVIIPVIDGEPVEVVAPREVYKNMKGEDITDSVANDPDKIQNEAEERSTAIGISVKDVVQTGDPTLYQFTVAKETSVVIKWRHDYALTLKHDFALTESQEKDATGNPWAGPLNSDGSGNPNPEVKKHWIKRGETVIAQIDGQLVDFSRAGLDIRYVPKGYYAGPPNSSASAQSTSADRADGVLTPLLFSWDHSAVASVADLKVGQSPPQRQQVKEFTMYAPAELVYVWQIQYGVKVNVDDPTRAGLSKVFEKIGGSYQEIGNLEGTFWFDPGASVRVATAANVTGPNSTALKGWISGDGFYFSSSGQINTDDGSLILGGPSLRNDGSPVATWIESFPDGVGKPYRGLEIPQLHRAARVLWQYGLQAIQTTAVIGEHVFQHDAARAATFTTEPDQIIVNAVTGANPTIGEGDMTIWDPVAAKLYPLVPGLFTAKWRPHPAATETVDVIVTVNYPNPAHYPHIAESPPVALDPDPTDNFVYKSVRYTENEASVDGQNRFTAVTPGKTVLLFAELQRFGRGLPREFLRVRVVETKRWNDNLPAPRTAIIGRKITDPALDLAGLGTGYIKFVGARYNPFIYDVTKLEGIAAKDVYDMAALRADNPQHIVRNPDALPGPVIPVNLHPGATDSERIVVVWYDDPTLNDELLWPHRARVYLPRWPVDASEGLGRIVIASEFGSESQILDANQTPVDQEVGPAIGDAPLETTYNPSRLQQPIVYVQPDPAQPGYNPNEEHGLMAPSLRFADVSPRPPAAYALRNNDLNIYNRSNTTFEERAETAGAFTSHPFVLVQFFDTADREFKMRVYKVVKEDRNIPGYRFARKSLITPDASGMVKAPARELQAEPHVRMEAGEPVIPFYPIGVVAGASPCPDTFGTNLKGQTTFWEDHKGSSWAVSGGELAWFTASFFYPMDPSFWWPPGESGFLQEILDGTVVKGEARFPQAGDCVSFLPQNINKLRQVAVGTKLSVPVSFKAEIDPTPVLYKSDWPANPPVLKAGETLTFQGGEFRADHPTRQIVDDTGELVTVETPGLPAIVAFAVGEVVFDSLNPFSEDSKVKSRWTARVAQVLDVRSVSLKLADFPSDLQPATKRTRVTKGKYIFNDLQASLQRRVRYDPLGGRLEMFGLLNDKEIGDRTLTAAPPAVYVLEPNIMTADEQNELRNLSISKAWQDAVDDLAKLTRNPTLIDSDNSKLPNPSDANYQSKLEKFWRHYFFGVLPKKSSDFPGLSEFPTVVGLKATDPVPTPISLEDADADYLVGLEPKALFNGNGQQATVTEVEPPFDPKNPPKEFPRPVRDPKRPAPLRGFGPGLALLPNAGFLDPDSNLPEISWVTVAENNDPSLEGSPITLHVIMVDRRERYRDAIQTIASDNVFDENLMLRHTGDFAAKADELFFEWWYRPDDGSLNVPPPDLIPAGRLNPWKLFPDPTGNRGKARYQITLKGNPNAPEALLADTWWFCRYRHKNDDIEGTNWNVPQKDATGTVIDDRVNFTWAGAGNSDPFNDFDGDGIKDFRAQLAQGWIKRVLDAVNPYEARIRDFEGDNPSTQVSMISQFGPRFEGPVALNPAKNVIENVGLIELYETILKRGRDLSIDLTRPVSTPAIANALQLVATRLADFYTILGNEAYADAQDPTIGVDEGSVAPLPDSPNGASFVFAFRNQVSSLLEEELALLRGVDDFFARPVYNRLFWNFTKGEGEAAYANNHNISDVNLDGFIDEDDAMILYPQGHGDAWGHYLTAMRNRYDLLNHRFFNWVSRSEFYNLQDIVIKVDFLDERKFAQTAAAKAQAGAEIVNLTYREKYVEDPTAQWQGYTDSNKDRAWGVQDWARRAGQGAYFDSITANALLPAVHPNERLEGIQRVDRSVNSDISVVSANLNAIQTTLDQANRGNNPIGLAGDAVPFDLNPALLDDLGFGKTYFEQLHERATKALENATALLEAANEDRNRIRAVANSEAEFRNSVFQQDLAYRNQLIALFGKPYEGTIGPGKIYPAGYDGPDLLLFMYVDVRQIDDSTVPGPTTGFAKFGADGSLEDGEIYQSFVKGQGSGEAPRGKLSDILNIAPELRLYLSEDVRRLFAPTFTRDGDTPAPIEVRSGLYSVKYTDLVAPKVELLNLTSFMPVTAAGYTFQAPREWGKRLAVGELQTLINQMIQQEASIASAIGAWDSLQGDIVRTLRLINAKFDMSANIRLKNEIFTRVKYITLNVIKAIEGARDILSAIKGSVDVTFEATKEVIPKVLPTGGLAVSPGDALSAARGAATGASIAITEPIGYGERILKITKLVAEIALDVAQNELDLFEKREADALAAKELLVGLENKVGDEPIKRIAVFKEVEALRSLSDQFRAKVDEGVRLIDERAAFNKRVAAQTQRERYRDMTFRVSRNHALGTYRQAADVAARYVYLAAKAYDYETNFDPSERGSASPFFGSIVRARTPGSLAFLLSQLAANHENQKGQLGFNNPQTESGKLSLRTELFRILPKGSTQPDAGAGDQFPSPGADADELWRQTLQDARVEDLWTLPEFREYCRPFASESDGDGNHVPQPGLVFRFSTQISAGKNFFGKPLSGGDHSYDPSHYATKVRAVGVWFSDYLSESVLDDLPAAPRIYLVPIGTDVMSVPSSPDPNVVRLWKVVDQRIPPPVPASTAALDNGNWIPLLDSLNGRLGEPRKFPAFRAYHDGGDEVNTDELVLDSRLVGRSVWNTQWLLIIPGSTLNADPAVGLDRFIEQVSDIKFVFQTYGFSGD
jgi:hypothetical protein